MPQNWISCTTEEAARSLLAIGCDELHHACVSGSASIGLVCLERSDARWTDWRTLLANRDGMRVAIGAAGDPLQVFALERVVTVDTTASGGNATLLTAAAADDAVLATHP